MLFKRTTVYYTGRVLGDRADWWIAAIPLDCLVHEFYSSTIILRSLQKLDNVPLR